MALSESRIRWLWSDAHNDTSDRMAYEVFARAIEAEVRGNALEEAARICDHYATALDGGANEYTRSRECMQAANAIRAMKETDQ